MTGTDELVAAIESRTGRQARRVGRETRLLCPVHDDHRPSLDVREGDDGRPLVTCRSHSCSYEAVCAAIGATPADFMPPCVDPGEGETVYPYRDEDGGLLFEVVRRPGKRFSQRRPDPNVPGGWVWNLEGVRRVPYRLPGLLAATTRTVFVVEGEKAVEAMVSAGLVATTNPGGAGKWRDDYAQYFSMAKRVVVLADDDEVGRTHADGVLRSLKTAGLADVRLVELYPKGETHRDIADWLAEHPDPEGARTRLRELVERVDPFERVNGPTIRADRVQPGYVEWLVPGLVPRGAVTLLNGDPGTGKSLWTCAVAAAETLNGGKVLVSTAEDSLALTVVPRLHAAGAVMDRVELVDEREFTLMLPDEVEALERLVTEHAVTLVVVDPLMAHLPGQVNSWRDQSVRLALRPLHRLAESTGAAVLLVHHLNKSVSNDPMRRVGGSVGILGAARSSLLLARDPAREAESPLRVLAQHKNNLGPLAPSRLLEIIATRGAVDGITVPASSAIVERGGCELSAAELLTVSEEPAAIDEAKGVLLAELFGGLAVPVNELKKAAEANGVAWRTVERAKKQLGVDAIRHGHGWAWKLPLEAEERSGGTVAVKTASPSATAVSTNAGGLAAIPLFEPQPPDAAGSSVAKAANLTDGGLGTTVSDPQTVEVVA